MGHDAENRRFRDSTVSPVNVRLICKLSNIVP